MEMEKEKKKSELIVGKKYRNWGGKENRDGEGGEI